MPSDNESRVVKHNWNTGKAESKKVEHYCENVPAQSPVIMTQFKGVRICGKRGGLPFLNVTRVEKNGKCPKGTKACGMLMSAENTVCYPQEEHASSCPITHIDIIEKNDAMRF